MNKFLEKISLFLYWYARKTIEILNYMIVLIFCVLVTAFLVIGIGNGVVEVINLLRFYDIIQSIADIREIIVGMNNVEIASMALSIGIIEETMFRYLLQDCILTRWMKCKYHIAWIIASILFGLAHLTNPQPTLIDKLPQVIGTTFGGLWFGYIYNEIGLHMSILTHALYDFVLLYIVINYAFF